MLTKIQLEDTLNESAATINALTGQQGAERIVQESLATLLGNESELEVPLQQIGARQISDSDSGRLDLLYNNHGIELKVIQMPRIKNTASNALYDIGQISGDYWRLQNADNLASGELVILLTGILVQAYDRPVELLREFHNRMFVDFNTSMLYGELFEESVRVSRSRQISAIYQMGFDKPYSNALGKKLVLHDKHDNLALLSIPVSKS